MRPESAPQIERLVDATELAREGKIVARRSHLRLVSCRNSLFRLFAIGATSPSDEVQADRENGAEENRRDEAIEADARRLRRRDLGCRENAPIENTVANSTAAGMTMNSDSGIQYT